MVVVIITHKKMGECTVFLFLYTIALGSISLLSLERNLVS